MAPRPIQHRRAPSGVSRSARWIAPLVVVLFAGLAAPARSADVVAVRVGQHPDFTRIVFELNAPTGYRLSRSTASDGSVTVVVTLDAAARSQTIRSGSALVRSVGIESGSAGKATARIALRKSDLPLKEMILSNPSRIVLDVLGTDTALKQRSASRVAATTAKPATAPTAKPATAPATPKQVARPAPKPAPAVAQTPPAPKPVAKTVVSAPSTPPKSAPAPAPKQPEPTLAKAPTPPSPAKAPEAPKASETPGPETASAEAAAPGAAAPSAGTSAEEAAREAMEARLEAVREASEARRQEAERARAEREAREVAQAKQRAEADASRAMPASGEGAWGSLDPMLIAGIAGALVLLVVLFVVLRRRRSLPKDLDVTMLAGDDGDSTGADDQSAADVFAMGGDADLPVASGSSGRGADSLTGGGERGAAGAGDPRRERAPLSAPGLFDELEKKNDEQEAGGSVMDQEVHDTGMDTMQSPPMRSAAGAGGADVASMLREMERRMAHLESRLDESVAARERLERQVAAQSEELRVQRAAIARTQRALRGLSRSDEEQATEPALRDPS